MSHFGVASWMCDCCLISKINVREYNSVWMYLCAGSHLGECASPYQQEKLFYHLGSSEIFFLVYLKISGLYYSNYPEMKYFSPNSFPTEQCLYKLQPVNNINYF